MPTKFDSTLTGTTSAPITVRAYPGERATIDGNIKQSAGGYVTFWGLEVMCSLPGRYTDQSGPWPTTWWVTQNGKQVDFCVSGFEAGGNPDSGSAWIPGMKFINCIVHDNIGGGFGLARSSAGFLAYGCLVYYNGWRGYNTATFAPQNHGHGFYIQHAGTAQSVVKNCFSYQNYSQGSQYYGTTAGYTDYGTYDGLIEWQNSHFQASQQRNMEYGNGAGVASVNPVIINSMVYDTRGSGSDSEFGDGSGMSNLIFTNNYFGSPVNFNGPITGAVSGNSFMDGVSGTVSSSSYPNNTFGYSQPTSGTKIAVYPNAYEAGRGNIVIFNWGKASTVTVDVSKVGLNVGDAYELHQADDYYNDVTYGTYSGSPITINMTGHTVAAPVGKSSSTDPNVVVATQPSTFPTFGAFVIMKKSSGAVVPPPPANTPPTVTSISTQTTKVGTAVGPIAFTVGDAQTAAASLTVTASSSNPTLVPNANIVLGGSGANRTVTVTPASGQSGTATITLSVSDGTTSTSTTFSVSVTATPITISSIADQNVAVGQTVGPISFTVSASSSATVAATSSNTALVPNANITVGGTGTNRTITVKPAANQSGKTTITVTATAGTQVASVSFSLSVNTPPAISGIPNQTVVENTSTPAIAFTVGDLETPATNLVVTAASSNPTLVPANGIVLGGSGASRTIKLTPATNQTGSATITVSASDKITTSSTNFVLTVNSSSTNSPSTNQTLVVLGMEAESGTLAAPMTVTNDTQMPARKFIRTTTANAGSATYTVDIPVAGEYVLWCKVLAPSYTNDSFVVSMDGVEDVYDEAEGKQSSNWQWTQVNGRAGTGTPGSVSPRTFNLTQGKHTLVFKGREAYAMIDRMILCNSKTYVPTEITATNDTVSALANTTTQIDPAELMANDKSTFADKLSISAVSLAKTGTVALTNGMINYTAKAGFTGQDSFTYTVTDGMGGNGSATVTVNVSATNTVRLGFDAAAGTLVAPMVVTADPQVPTRKMVWATAANSGTASFTLNVPKAGTYYLWSRVLAPSYTNDSFTVTVNGASDVFDAAEDCQSTNWQWAVLNGRGTTGTPKALNPRTLKLNQGDNTIVFAGREAYTGLDRLVVTDDASFVPKDIIVVNDAISAFAGVMTPIATADLLRNDYSLFGDAIQVKSVGTAQNGTVTLAGASVNYTPKSGFKGTDTFTYTVGDSLGNTATGTVTVTVQ